MSRIMVGMIVGCCSMMLASAQNRPKMMDTGVDRTTVPTIELQESPIDVSGSLVANVGSRDIIALAGKATYMSPSGLRTFTWDHQWGGFLLNGNAAFRSGTSIRFPAVPDPSGKHVYHRDFDVEAVVLADGSTWGTRGPALKAKMADRARAARIHLRNLLDQCQGEDSDMYLLKVLTSEKPYFPAPLGKSLQMELRVLLMERGTHELVANPLQVLQGEIDRLGAF